MGRRTIQSCVLAFLLTVSADGKAAQYFVPQTFDDGLPSNNITVIEQDKDGYLWIGTNDGLARFDGHRYEIFRNIPGDETSLPQNWIQTLLHDGDRSLWFGTDGGGLGWIDTQSLRIGHLNSENSSISGDTVWAIAEGPDQSLWIAPYDGGIQRFDLRTRTFDPPIVRSRGSKFGNVFGLAMEFDHRDRLWIATGGAGVLIHDTSAGTLVQLKAREGDSSSLPHDVVFDLESHREAMWLATQNGIAVQRPDREGFDRLFSRESSGGANAGFTDILIAQDGNLWGAARSELLHYDIDTQQTRRFRHRPAVYGSLPNVQVESIFEDREGQIWIGTEGGGLYRLKPDWQNFAFYMHEPTRSDSLPAAKTQAVFAAEDGTVWIGSLDAGLSRLDPATESVTNYDADNSNLPIDATAFSIAPADSGSLWVGMRGVLVRFDPGSGRALSSFTMPGSPAELRAFKISQIVPDAANSTLWLNVDTRGLVRFSPADAQFRWISNDPQSGVRGKNVEHLKRVGESLWVAHEKGIDAFNAQSGTFQPVLISKQVQSFAVADDGLWVAHDTGLHRYRLDGDRVTTADPVASAPADLPPITFYSVDLDVRGHLWLTSGRGLFRLDPDSGMVNQFTRPDGLPSAEFLDFPTSRSSDGTYYASNALGVVAFKPQNIRISSRAPRVVIDRVSTADGDLDKTTPAQLPHDTDNLTFEFTALSLVDPDRNQYAFRLRGLEEEWVQAGTRRERTYNFLPPGDFTFEVIASDSHGTWNTRPATYHFTILPPPWRTPVAYAGYVVLTLVAIGLALLAYRARSGRRRELERARERQNWAETQRDMTMSLTSTLDVKDIVDRLIDGLRDVVSFDKATVAVLCRGLPEIVISRGQESAEASPRKDIQAAINAFRTNGYDEPSTLSAMGQVGQNMTVPIASGDDVLGVAMLTRAGDDAFVERDRLMASTYARQAGSALQNARLFDEVKTLADEADSANRAKSEFLAKMSHEIRTPMNGVLGMTELLMETQLDKGQKKYARAVQDSGKVLLSIINDILDLSKIEAGRLEIESIPFHVGQLAEEVVRLFSANAERTDVSLGYVVDYKTPRQLLGDPTRIRQVLMNLLSNAIKFTNRGEVRLDISPARHGIRFQVRDSGIGMGKEEVQQLFQPFTQADQSTSRRYGGTGLGLAICKQLVERMGGTIEVVSKPGRGSIFWFELPLEKGEQPPARLPGSDWLKEGPALLVLGNSLYRDAVEQWLRYYGASTMVPGDECADKPVMIVADDSVRKSPIVSRADRFRAGLWIGVSSPPSRSFRPLPPPLFESDLVMALIEASELDADEKQLLKETGPHPIVSQPRRILLVEDNVMNQNLLLEMLESMGHEVDVVDCAADCYKQALQDSYDVILMDCDLPGQDGLQASRRLREAGSGIRIVALTAHAGDEYRRRCLEAGMDDYVSKPVSKASLREALARTGADETHTAH